ncbi:MAG: outer membrane beta-barrel protein [Saprospiraceae bacterium]|nr:outer membrane beta-barrel protein [Saprospiraceae bacterium]MBK8298046.1 outer membrane beta-barrel protein [Saprospiraceae bacterium]
MIKRVFCILVNCSIWVFSLSSQLNSLENLEQLDKGGLKKTLSGFFKDFYSFGDPFQLGGGLSINMRSYDAMGGPLRQDPFFYTINANVNVKIYQIDLPFSMVLTAKNTSKSYPSFSDLKESLKDNINNRKNGFARIGISPYYKWAKLHLGHRSMNFSKYTLNNLNFFGAGMMLEPGKLRVGAMYGRIAKAEPINLSLVTPNLPVYQRIGWGTKIGYGDDKASADVTVFTAKDDDQSIDIPASYSKQVSPEANLVLGIQLQKLFFEKFRVKFDFTNSGVSPNTLDADAADKSITNFLLKKKTTSYYGNALESSVGYEGKSFNAGISLNRIDSDFETFGAYFFNRDIMDVQAFTNFGLIQNKLNTSLKFGTQSNNLDGSKPTTTTRLIYDINTVWSAKKINVQANYSNNASDITYVLNQQLDSLNAVVVTQDIGLNVTYTLPFKSQHQHLVSLSGNMQDVSDDIEKTASSTSSKLFLINTSYVLKTKSKWAFTTRVNYNKNEFQGTTLNRTGFGAGVKKEFLSGKLSLGINSNYFLNKNASGSKSTNLQSILNIGYQLFKGLNTQFTWGLLTTKADPGSKFTENTANLGLQYNFNYAPKAKKSKK